MRIPENTLLAIAKDILERLGEDRTSAETAARYLVRADMRGVSTHGINLLRLVAQRVGGRDALPSDARHDGQRTTRRPRSWTAATGSARWPPSGPWTRPSGKPVNTGSA